MTGMPRRLPTLFEQFMSAAASAANSATSVPGRRAYPTWPVNPFPQGVRSGSATDRVLQELKRCYPEVLAAGQLRFRCAANRGAVTWAVRYLAEHGLIEVIRHDPRNPCWNRYKWVDHG